MLSGSGHGPHAREIHGAAVEIHQPLEKRDRFVTNGLIVSSMLRHK